MSQVEEARNWLADCFPWDEIESCDDREIWDGVDRHYEGGIIQFAKDSDDANPFIYIPHHGIPTRHDIVSGPDMVNEHVPIPVLKVGSVDCGPCTGYASRIRSL